jgi:hypothetical protein
VVQSAENPGQLPDEPEKFGVKVQEGAFAVIDNGEDPRLARDFIPTEGSFESTTLD